MSTIGTTTTGTSTSSGTADAAKGAASEVAGEATSAASDVKETVKSEVGSVVSDAADRAGEVLRTSQDELRAQVETKAKHLSSTLDDAARQLASMADGAEDPNSALAQLAKSASGQLRRQSRRLEQGGLEGVVGDVKRFARDRPGAFMLGTVAAGFAFGRLAKHADLKQAVDTAKQELTSNGESAQQQGMTSSGTGGSHLPSGTGTSVGTSIPPSPAAGTVPADPDPTGTDTTGQMGGQL